MRYRTIYTAIGIFLGLGAPGGWLLWRLLSIHEGWLFSWFRSELTGQGQIYLYLMIPIVVFAIFGYVLGKRVDQIRKEAESVKGTFNELNLLAATDGLTGLQNARSLHERLSVEFETAKRYQSALTCLLLDIDDFKAINDAHGHPFGDFVLVTLGTVLQQCVRRVDTVGRLGGEEFLIILPRTSPEVAVPVADRIRRAVEQGPFSKEGVKAPVTVSIGIACFPRDDIKDKSSFLKAVDQALYSAKRSGKNKVVMGC